MSETQGEGGERGMVQVTLHPGEEFVCFPKSGGQPLAPCHGSRASIQPNTAIPGSSVGFLMSMSVRPRTNLLPPLQDTSRSCGMATLGFGVIEAEVTPLRFIITLPVPQTLTFLKPT